MKSNGTKFVSLLVPVLAGGVLYGLSLKHKYEMYEIQRGALLARHDAILREWDKFNADPVRVLTNPTLMIHKTPTRIKLADAFWEANLLRSYFEAGKIRYDVTTLPYYRAVNNLEHLWGKAQKISEEGHNELTSEQLDHLQNALTHLENLMNPESSLGEKRMAYNTFLQEIQKVTPLDEPVMEAIESYLG